MRPLPGLRAKESEDAWTAAAGRARSSGTEGDDANEEDDGDDDEEEEWGRGIGARAGAAAGGW